jgi:hypothetical protein
MQSQVNLLLPALLFSVIGIVIGVIATLLIVDRTRAKPDDKGGEDKPSTSNDVFPGLPTDRFDQVARLYRERTSGRLVAEVDKKVYLTPDSAPANVRRELEMIVEGLATWLQKPVPNVTPPVNIEPTPPAAPYTPEPSVKSANSEGSSSTSIVGQINDILQEVLEESNFADRRVSLTQEPSMGVVVWVDGTKYPGIDAVPDPEIKGLIQAAVKKWEKKNDLSHRYP